MSRGPWRRSGRSSINRAVWVLPLVAVLLVGLALEGERPPSLLILDFNLAAPQRHASMLRLFADSGYLVEYRKSYPQLVKHDFREYDALMLLAGGTPDYPGSMLSPRALGRLKAFVRDGNVLILGTPANPRSNNVGENERTVFNALLRRLKLPIYITKGWIWDSEETFAATLFDAPWLYPDKNHSLTADLPDRLQLPRAAALQVGNDVAVLVRTSPTANLSGHSDEVPGAPLPVMVMGKSGKGLVVVSPRSVLNPSGSYQVETPLLISPEQRAARQQLVRQIADYTIDWLRGNAVWEPGSMEAAPSIGQETARPPFWRSVPLANRVPGDNGGRTGGSPPKKAAGMDRLEWRRSLGPRYQWIESDRVRAGWVYVDRDEAVQQAVANVLNKAGLNLLWGTTDAELLAQPGQTEKKAELREQWARMDRLLQGSDVKWFMGSHVPGWQADLSDYPPVMGAQGQQIGGMSPIDWRFWLREILPALRAEAEFSTSHRSVGGLLIDLEMYPLKYWYLNNGFDFGEVAFRRYLQYLSERGMTDRFNRAAVLAPDERFDWLVARGLLEEYHAVLGAEAERIGRYLRHEVRRINPSLLLGFYTVAVPTGWFYEGLLRGASTRDEPVLLLTFQHAPDEELDHAFASEIYLLHVGAILLGQVEEGEIEEVVHARLRHDHGYWLNNIATLASEDPEIHRRSKIESPRDGTADDYISAIAAANRSFRFKK